MRHGDKINNLGRSKAHRQALLRNLAIAIITHKKIVTTLAKARSLRTFVEPLLTKSKNNTTHARRTVFAYLQDKHATKELFDNISHKIATRNGGYTRIIKLGQRVGDAASMAYIELVDYNTTYVQDKQQPVKTRRTRRGGKSQKIEATQVENKAELSSVDSAESTLSAENSSEVVTEKPNEGQAETPQA